MQIIRRILVPTDFQESSVEATRYAAELAQKFDASITLFHVYQLPVITTPDGAAFGPSPHATQEVFDRVDNSLATARQLAEANGAPYVSTLSAAGVAHAEIVREAKEGAYDLIVMGTHGRTGLSHLLLGSVAELVVRKAHCPVLTIRQEHPAHEPSTPSAEPTG
jgi:nucleotide-binding universal stress UspA family protein